VANSFLSISSSSTACIIPVAVSPPRIARPTRRALSQQDLLESQRRLYDLGLFKQVDTAIQNPDGTESRKTCWSHGEALDPSGQTRRTQALR